MDTLMQWALIVVVVLGVLAFFRTAVWLWLGLSFLVVSLLGSAYDDVVGDDL